MFLIHVQYHHISRSRWSSARRRSRSCCRLRGGARGGARGGPRNDSAAARVPRSLRRRSASPRNSQPAERERCTADTFSALHLLPAAVKIGGLPPRASASQPRSRRTARTRLALRRRQCRSAGSGHVVRVLRATFCTTGTPSHTLPWQRRSITESARSRPLRRPRSPLQRRSRATPAAAAREWLSAAACGQAGLLWQFSPAPAVNCFRVRVVCIRGAPTSALRQADISALASPGGLRAAGAGAAPNAVLRVIKVYQDHAPQQQRTQAQDAQRAT